LSRTWQLPGSAQSCGTSDWLRTQHPEARRHQGPDALQDGVSTLRVDPNGRLVQDERARSVQQAGADVEAPFHAPAVGLDPIVAAIRQVDQFQDLVHPLTQRRTAEPIEPAEEGQVLPCGQVGIEGHVLGHVSNLGLGRCGRRTDRRPADGDFAGVCGQQAANQTDGRGLAGAVRAEQTVGLPGAT